MVKVYLRDHSKINKLSHRTDVVLSKRLVERFGDQPLSSIIRQDVERFRAVLLSERKSPATVNRYVGLLKGIFNKAIQWGKTNHNPVVGIPFFKEQHRIRFLADEEEDRLKAATPPEDWPIVEFAIHTGLRSGEQFNLRWENVDLQNKVLTIPRSKSGETRYVQLNSKT
jgi:integrase